MRKLIAFCLVALSCCSQTPAFADSFMYVKKKAAASSAPCSSANTYYGWTDVSGVSNSSGDANYTYGMGPDCGFAVPGSGTVRVCEISSYTYGTGNIRLAIYDNAAAPQNLVCEGAAQVAVTGAAYAWQGHTAYTSIKPVGGSAGDACTLTKGTVYLLQVSLDSNSTITAYKTQTSQANGSGSSDYTDTGFPATKQFTNSGNIGFRLRVGVQ